MGAARSLQEDHLAGYHVAVPIAPSEYRGQQVHQRLRPLS